MCAFVHVYIKYFWFWFMPVCIVSIFVDLLGRKYNIVPQQPARPQFYFFLTLINTCTHTQKCVKIECWNPYGNGCYTKPYTCQSLDNTTCQGWTFAMLFFLSLYVYFSLHWKSNGRGSSKGNFCPFNTEAGRHIQTQMLILFLNYIPTKKKGIGRGTNNFLCAYLLLSLKSCSGHLRWLASRFPFFVSECQPQGGQSQH